ncbi:cytochrome c biogenesis protein CcmG/thiol:disulfide interchange protein DsbE [Rhodobacter sp. 140A]|uniref:DsbE family thiol:disulfide interchange protein n=3 Tax=root TaxID=1 RepID=A0A3S3PC89_9RHOB|nr:MULTISPECIES: DsbE family thiol:disulfide interchange protein [Sinirhodobacter]RBP89191.1 cytochrome c biogenesis protein CcmG/thiol:disulfide interchange protein DsbE [Rhodobacter sp. 140A]RWR45254.1 DsbE family thiol:disulfide interchange protein [Sinirhodobacter ferrireducens]RWR48827.1 DsbE family thiol:disulfide interchange protein [Sinirhodobacter huangdaonensis]
MVKPLVLLPPVAFAALAGLFLWGMNRTDPTALPSALIGKAAPPVETVPLGEAQMFTDADLRDGKIKLVNFWASWCAPCRVEHPTLKAMAEDGVEIYGVNWKDKPAQALSFLADLGDPFARIGADPKNTMGLDWGVAGVPETFVIDGEGTVLMRYAGPITQKVLDEQIAPLLAGEGE